MKTNLVKLLAAGALFFSASAMMSQALKTSDGVLHQVPSQRTCGTMDHHEYLKQTRPGYEQEVAQYNQMLDSWLETNRNNLNTEAVINIPVVIHVVYRTAAENISDAQAISQFSVLNNDFNRLNADSVNTPAVFAAVAGRMGVNFCLAQRDPNGNPTTGVIHKSTTVTSFSTDDKVKSSAQGGDDPWDVTRYVNIWVCNLGSSLLGYGEFPTGSISNTWGLVLNYTCTGTMGTAQAPFNLGRTGTHEFGHCFNLNHIWGDNGQCGASDNCIDTPPQRGGTAAPAGCNYGSPTFPWQPNTCTRPDGAGGANVTNTNGDMFMNYMDYTNDGSMNMFTKNQCTRMLAVVSNPPWNVLQSSNGCTPVNALDASMASILNPTAGTSTCNNSITPRVVLSNTGSTTLTSATITYNMDGGTNQTLNWTGSLASAASATITLNNYTGLSNAAHTFSVSVSAPNGGTDGYAANNIKTSTFTVTAAPAGSALPFTQGFETATFPPTGWSYTVVNASNSWTRLANTFGLTAGSTAIAKMDNFTSGSVDPRGQRDALVSPPISLAAANSTLQVQFDVSHKMYNTTYIDSLNVWISTDCGGTWTKLYNKGGTTLATVTPASTTAFTPTANSQWRRETVSLSSYAGLPVVYLKFESVSGWGNNLYLDNINVSYTPSAAPPTANFTAAATKCAGQAIAFTDASTNTPTSWAWTTNPSAGVTIASANSQNPNITFTNAGTYTVSLLATNGNGSNSTSQSMVVNATPAMTSASTGSACSGAALNIPLTSSTAANYSWIANNNANTTGESTTAQTTTTINNTVTISTGTTAQTINYTVTPTGTTGGCVGAPQTVTVTINPRPTMSSAGTYTVCSGAAMNLALTSAVPSTYSWLSNNNANTTGESTTAQTGATINNTVTSTATTAQTLNYTVTPTSTAGSCAGTAQTVTVTVNPAPAMTSAATATVCSGTALSLALTSNIASTYSWIAGNNANTTGESTTAQTSTTINNTITHTNAAAQVVNYTVTPTSTAGSCAGTAQTVAVTVNPLPTMTSATTGSACSGTALSIPLTSSTGATYSWLANNNASTTGESTTAQTNATINNTVTISTGTAAQTLNYTVTPTGTTGGCVGAAQTVTVTINPTPAMSSAGTYSVCSGSAMNLALTSAVPSTYSWLTSNNANTTGESTTAQTTTTINNTVTISTGTTAQTLNYTVTPTSTTGSCAGAAQTVTVTVNPAPTMTSASAATVCSGTALNIALTSNVASSYSWIAANNPNTTGESTTAQTTTTINNTINSSSTSAQTVSYTVTPTATAGSCAGVPQTLTVTVNPRPTMTSATTTSACSGTAVNFPFTSNMTSTYSWIAPATANVTGESTTAQSGATLTNTLTITGTTPRTVTYSVTPSSGGCAGTVQTITVTVNPLPTVTAGVAPSATVCAGTQITLSGGGATSYTWTGGVTNGTAFTPASSGSYTVTGTNANGCQNTATRSIVVNDLPTVTASSSPASGSVCSGSQITLNGGGATSYTWSGGITNGTAFTPASSGTYTVTGTDGNGCQNTTTQAVTVNNLPSVTVNSPSTCSGVATTLTAGGASTYSWSTSQTGGSISVSPTGNTSYTVTGTDANGCQNTAIANVTVTSAPNVTVNSMSICPGQSATLTGNGATTYSWNTGDNTQGITVNPTSTTSYTVTGSNGPGCQNTAIATVTVNDLPTVGATVTPSSTVCNGASMTLSGTGASSYSWSGGINDATSFAPASSGSYTVTGTDANGCQNTFVQAITVNNLPTVGATASPSATVCDGASLTLSGTGANSYTWSGGINDGVSFTPASSNSYTVTGTDANGCQNTFVQAVTVGSNPTVTTSSSASSTVCSGSPVTLTAGGATTYSWNTGDNTDVITVNPTATTTYTATGMDAAGCSSTSVITVDVFPVNTPTVSQTGYTLTASGAVSYQWYLDGNILPGETGSTLTATQNGSYTVETIDANGCSAMSTATVVSGIGIKETAALNAQVSVYPNPNNGNFSVNALLNSKSTYTMSLTNVLGEVIYRETVQHTTAFSKTLTVAEQSNGVYFFIIRDENGNTSVHKVIVEK